MSCLQHNERSASGYCPSRGCRSRVTTTASNTDGSSPPTDRARFQRVYILRRRIQSRHSLVVCRVGVSDVYARQNGRDPTSLCVDTHHLVHSSSRNAGGVHQRRNDDRVDSIHIHYCMDYADDIRGSCTSVWSVSARLVVVNPDPGVSSRISRIACAGFSKLRNRI